MGAQGGQVDAGGFAVTAGVAGVGDEVADQALAPREISRRAMRTLFALLDDEGGTPPPYGVE
ncbi:hypothetical protein ACWD4T_49465, partial [Streptomyces umbrinus]